MNKFNYFRSKLFGSVKYSQLLRSRVKTKGLKVDTFPFESNDTIAEPQSRRRRTGCSTNFEIALNRPPGEKPSRKGVKRKKRIRSRRSDTYIYTYTYIFDEESRVERHPTAIQPDRVVKQVARRPRPTRLHGYRSKTVVSRNTRAREKS